MKRSYLLGALAIAGSLALAAPCGAATFFLSDVSNWIGPAAGPGINQAVLVLDWSDAQPAWAWGYRWEASQTKTGADLLAAVLGAEQRLTAAVSPIGFVSNVGWNGQRFQGDFNPGTGAYWNYFVNNQQQPGNYNDGAAPIGAHILSALGSPYDESGPGQWVSSNTGILGRPLIDGAWDGLVYADFNSVGPAFASNAPAVPEPSWLVNILWLFVWKRRRSH